MGRRGEALAIAASAAALVAAGCGPSTSTGSAGGSTPSTNLTIRSSSSGCGRADAAKAVAQVGKYRGSEAKLAGGRIACADGWMAVEAEVFNGASTEREPLLFEADGGTWVERDRDDACSGPSQPPAAVARIACDG